MENTLTERQEALLHFIEDYQMEYGASPTLREMREHFGVASDNGILKHLDALRTKGYLEKESTPRGIKLLENVRRKLHAEEGTQVPILGTIPAGTPTLAAAEKIGTMTLDSSLVGDPRNTFLLRVSGQSMRDAGILEGDFVLVSTHKEARSGDIVVALVDGENTIKRLIREGNRIALKPENPAYGIIYPENELCVQGVVTALLRQY